MTKEWREVKAVVQPGPIWAFRRGYRVNEAGMHENEKQFRAFTFHLNCGKEANRLQRKHHREQIDDFRKANEDQARLMMGVSSDLMGIVQKRIEKAEREDEEIPMHLISGLMRAASNISDSGRQAWATSLGVNELMSVVEQEIEEVQVEVMDEGSDEAYDIPLDE